MAWLHTTRFANNVRIIPTTSGLASRPRRLSFGKGRPVLAVTPRSRRASSVAVTEPTRVEAWFDEFGADRIVLALDVTIDAAGPVLATHGWTKSSGLSLWDLMDRYAAIGARHLLCTDIGRDGAMSGPNVDLYAEIVRRYPHVSLQASGGVRDIADIERLREVGVPAAITGKALLDGKITATEVNSFLQSA